MCIEALRPGTVPEIIWTFSYYLCYINSTVPAYQCHPLLRGQLCR